MEAFPYAETAEGEIMEAVPAEEESPVAEAYAETGEEYAPPAEAYVPEAETMAYAEPVAEYAEPAEEYAEAVPAEPEALPADWGQAAPGMAQAADEIATAAASGRSKEEVLGVVRDSGERRGGGLNLKKELGKNFEHRAAEARWYPWWEEQGFFRAGQSPGKLSYCIVIPPPNVTGVLHLGHALNNTLQDILIRYQRMQGKNVLWQPGTDHAGIASQYVVDRELRKEGLSREKLGREQFIARVWQWKEEKGDAIIQQLKRLGASCDWNRTRFTMDEGLSRSVREVFVRLYQEGLIYRGEYMVNWCPSCGTALSQLEVELSETDEQGNLWHIRYPLAEGPGRLTVATTRPEAMLGDTAVAG